MIEPNELVRSVVRIDDAVEDRSTFLCLDKNERVDPWPDEDYQALIASLANADLRQYPVIQSFREELARWIGVDPDWLMVTGGSDPAIRATFDVFGQRRQTVMMCQPTFAMYAVYAKLADMQVAALQYGPSLELPLERVVNEIENVKPRLLCLPNPNSPTGTQFSVEQLRAVLECAAQYETVVLIDEAYYYFSDQTALTLVADFPNLIVTRTFSKAGGIAGVRLGFAVSQPRIIEFLRRPKPMYEISSLSLRMGQYLIAHDHILHDYAASANAGARLLREQLPRFGLTPLMTYGNFVVARVPEAIEPTAIAAALKSRGVLIKAGFPDACLRDCIRVSTASPATMSHFLQTLGQVWQTLSPQLRTQ